MPKAIACPVLKAFYRGANSSRTKREKPRPEHGFEQLSLF